MEMYFMCVLLVTSAVAVSNSVPVESFAEDFESKSISLNTDDGGEHVSAPRLNEADKENSDVGGKKDASATIEMLEDSMSNLQDRAICPWKYSINTNSNRQPADLIVATCTTRTAAGTERRCEHIYHKVPVQTKQTSSEGVVTWVDDWEMTPVGCTLV